MTAVGHLDHHYDIQSEMMLASAAALLFSSCCSNVGSCTVGRWNYAAYQQHPQQMPRHSSRQLRSTRLPACNAALPTSLLMRCTQTVDPITR